MGTKLRFDQVLDSQFASQAELDYAISLLSGSLPSNPGAEVNTSGWSASGSNFTISRTTTSGQVLKGVASFLLAANGSQAVNDYISTSFTIDPGDTNSVWALSFYFKGISNYDSGDMEVVLHDGTNEILPSITVIPGGSGFFKAIWITNSNTSYTIRFKAKVTSAFSISIDNVIVDRKEVVQGATVGPTIDYGAIVLGATTTTPTFGTVTYNQTYGRRVGDKFEFWGSYEQTGAGGAGSGTYTLKIPTSVGTIDLSKITSDSAVPFAKGSCGEFIGKNNGGTVFGGTIQVADNLEVYVTFHDPSNNNWGSSALDFGSNASLRFSFFLSVPIVGWSADVVLQNCRVEYVFNYSTNNGDDTTSFGTGVTGAVIPAVTGQVFKTVEFLTPIQPTDDIKIEADWDAQGVWVDWEDRGYDFSQYGKLGATWEYDPSSKYKIIVSMRGGQYARFKDSTASPRTYTQENSAGSRWRVRKTANPLAVESAHIVEFASVRNEQTSGTAGGTATTGAWTDLTLNTLDNPNGYGWISLSSNIITLQPGTYSLEALKSFYRTDTSSLRLYNTTTSAMVILGTVVAASSGSGLTSAIAEIKKNLVLTQITSFKLQYYVGTSTGSSDLGNAGSQGEEVYADIQIRKYA